MNRMQVGTVMLGLTVGLLGCGDDGVEPMDDAGRVDGMVLTPTVGAACTADADCPGIDTVCLPESSFPGGYCSQACGTGCPMGATCDPRPGREFCLQSCEVGATPRVCRVGYGCVTFFGFGSGPRPPPHCAAGCSDDTDCPAGLRCDPGAPDGYGPGECDACGSSCSPTEVCEGGACVPPEICNGIDDDGDGDIDDGLGLVWCGVGACTASAPACVGGVAGTCTPGTPGVETCNGIDDNCDGAVDAYPRDPDEWQGMLVDMCTGLLCAESAHCQAACIDGVCGRCLSDADCAAGEACALDHCVLEANVDCRGRADCAGDALCILTLATGEGMCAFCTDMGSPPPGCAGHVPPR